MNPVYFRKNNLFYLCWPNLRVQIFWPDLEIKNRIRIRITPCIHQIPIITFQNSSNFRTKQNIKIKKKVIDNLFSNLKWFFLTEKKYRKSTDFFEGLIHIVYSRIRIRIRILIIFKIGSRSDKQKSSCPIHKWVFCVQLFYVITSNQLQYVFTMCNS